jgi:hypothetical protein
MGASPGTETNASSQNDHAIIIMDVMVVIVKEMKLQLQLSISKINFGNEYFSSRQF